MDVDVLMMMVASIAFLTLVLAWLALPDRGRVAEEPTRVAVSRRSTAEA